MTTTTPRYPKDREAKRRVLLDAVETVHDAAIAGAGEAERDGRLPASVVAALDASGLFALKLPAELGGAEADPVTQIDVLERITYIEPSVGWCTFVGATSAGWAGAFLPEESLGPVFDGAAVPHIAGSGGVIGRGVAVEGGYEISGRFRFASGIGHADWLIGAAAIADASGEVVEARSFLVPASDAIHHDNWQVAGLKGSSSADYSLDAAFVSEAMTWLWPDVAQGRPKRGGTIFRLGMPAFVMNEHAAFAFGAARRALDLVTETGRSKVRGQGASTAVPTLIAERPVFQRFLGEADLRLRSVRSLVIDLNEQAWQEVSAGRSIDAKLGTELRAASVLATETAVDIATQAMRFGGGGALYLDNMLQRCWRDVIAGGQHFGVSDAAYEAHGQALLGTND